MKTALTDLFNIEFPIVQGAMAWVADEDLASAVSKAGGLGVLGTGSDTLAQAQAKVERMLTLTNRPFGVNVVLLNPHAPEIMEYLRTSGVKVVFTGAGTPKKYMPGLVEAGIKVVPVVATVAQAKKMEALGASAVVIEGMEAGGHIGRTTTLPLLAQVTRAVDIPVIAAGGFADGRGLAAALMLGASGIQMGTRFVVADESNAHDNFKQAIIDANDLSTVITGQITGHPVRVLRNPLSHEYLALEKQLAKQDDPDLAPLNDLASDALRLAVVEGDIENGSLMAGQIAGLITQRQDVRSMMEEIVAEAQATIRHAYECYL